MYLFFNKNWTLHVYKAVWNKKQNKQEAFRINVSICQSDLCLIQDTKLIISKKQKTKQKMKAHLLNDQEKFYSM